MTAQQDLGDACSTRDTCGTGDTVDDVEAVAVVVPVHDEEDLLEACLRALAAAVDAASEVVDVVVVVVLDGCTDRSAEIAGRFPFTRVHTTEQNVGAARAAGVDVALAELAARRPGTSRAAVWVASTDADSQVPVHWVTEHVRVARSGVDLLVGTVRPDFRDLTPEQRAAWSATHVLGVANGHVHGANLGIRASVYRGAGGYPALDEHEDVELVAAARRAGAREAATDRCWVLTSGRTVGRTPGGYARHLRESLLPG